MRSVLSAFMRSMHLTPMLVLGKAINKICVCFWYLLADGDASHDEHFLASGCTPLIIVPCQGNYRQELHVALSYKGLSFVQSILRFHASGDIITR